MRILCLIFISVLKWTSGFSQQIPTRDYEIYTDVIRAESVTSTTAVVVAKELVNEQDSEIVASALSSNDFSTLASISHEYRFDSASVNALNNYFKRDTSKVVLENKFLTPIPVRLIADDAFDAYFKKNISKGWKRFYKDFPGSEGVFKFSRITYSNSGDRAVIYRAISRNGLNGNGSLLGLVLNQSHIRMAARVTNAR